MLYYSPHTECLGIGIYHELKVILEYEKDIMYVCNEMDWAKKICSKL